MSLGLNRETLSRKPPSRLAEFLAESEGPLGSLTVGGDDLGRLIRDETDSTVLRSALERVRRVHDTRWVIEIERRLLALKLEPELAMQHIATLLRAHSIEEAAVTLGRIKRRSVSPASYLDAGARIALQMNDFEPVRSALSQPDVLGRQAHRSLYIDFLRRLLGAGDIAAFSIEFGIAQVDFADDPALATLAVQIVAMRDGPEAAEGYLESQLNLLPRNSATAMRLKAGLLLERGRYRECFEFTTSRIAKDPGKLTLYPLAADAARHSNGIEVVARLVETAAVIFPQSLEVQVMRCGLAAEQSEFEKAEGLLPRILENSDWAYRRAVLDVACQQPGVDRAIAAYEDCRTVGIRSGGPEINLSNYLYFYHAAAGGLSRARSLLEPLVASRANDSAFLRTYFRILTALGAEKECRRAFEQLPLGVKMTAALRPFAAFFRAQDMQHDEARKIWRDQLAAAAPVAINAASSYPRTICLRYKDRPGAVLAFLTIFNGIEFVDWFLDYYRNLGVDHFFAVDNGSDDGTFERLLAAEDVSVFRNLGSFAQSGFGVFWINYLLRRFGVDHWCFHLDMDEAFVFPGMERGRRLSDLLGYLDSRGHQSARHSTLTSVGSLPKGKTCASAV
jgi:hypothetical protein